MAKNGRPLPEDVDLCRGVGSRRRNHPSLYREPQSLLPGDVSIARFGIRFDRLDEAQIPSLFGRVRFLLWTDDRDRIPGLKIRVDTRQVQIGRANVDDVRLGGYGLELVPLNSGLEFLAGLKGLRQLILGRRDTLDLRTCLNRSCVRRALRIVHGES